MAPKIRFYKNGNLLTYVDVLLTKFAPVNRARSKLAQGDYGLDWEAQNNAWALGSGTDNFAGGTGQYENGESIIDSNGKVTIGSVQLFDSHEIVFYYGMHPSYSQAFTNDPNKKTYTERNYNGNNVVDGAQVYLLGTDVANDIVGNVTLLAAGAGGSAIVSLPTAITDVGMNYFAWSFGSAGSRKAAAASAAYAATTGIRTLELNSVDNDDKYNYKFTISAPASAIWPGTGWWTFPRMARAGFVVTLTIEDETTSEEDVVYCSAISKEGSNLYPGSFLSTYGWATYLRLIWAGYSSGDKVSFSEICDNKVDMTYLKFASLTLPNKFGGFLTWVNYTSSLGTERNFIVSTRVTNYSQNASDTAEQENIGDTFSFTNKQLAVWFLPGGPSDVLLSASQQVSHCPDPGGDLYGDKIAQYHTQDLIAYYSFAGGSLKNRFFDLHHGETRGVLMSAPDRFSRSNEAYAFTPRGYIDCGSEPLNITGEMTVAVWAYFEENPGTDHAASRIISKHGWENDKRGWTLMRMKGPNNLKFGVSANVSSSSNPQFYAAESEPNSCPLGQWLHIVAMTKRSVLTAGLEMKIYINGEELTRSSWTATLPSNFVMKESTKPLEIGADGYAHGAVNNEKRRMDGSLDDIGIWKRALSVWEIQNLSKNRPPRGAAYGDPYITPFYGSKYKLPDRYGVYRYISSRAPYDERFTLDVDVLGLTKEQQREGLKILVKKYKDCLAKYNKKVVLNGFFFRNYMLTNKGEKLLVDTEANTINNCPVEKFEAAEDSLFTVKVSGKQTITMEPRHGKTGIALYTVSIATHHETYGDITIELYKFENPQWRNGIMMHTGKCITHENSKGLILGFQHAKNFTIKKLGSKKDISDFNTKKVFNTKKIVEEFSYIEEKGEKINTKKVITRFIQQR